VRYRFGRPRRPREVTIDTSKTRVDSADIIEALPRTGETTTLSVTLDLRTTQTTDFVDITDRVRRVVSEAGVAEGIVLVSSPHTTCQIIINEAEDGFLRDLANFLERVAPETGEYEHDAAPHDLPDEVPNGYAHVRAALLSSPSVTLPITEGQLTLGTWQRLFFVELDRARPRRYQVTVLGRSS
jgi:secondary thiamine-phosphate synthase enzyme